MPSPLHHLNEASSNAARDQAARFEPRALRTYTPTQAVLAKSAGIYHWTPEGRRLYDFTSGVLVTNLGHNPQAWMKRFTSYMGWSNEQQTKEPFSSALPFSAYNAVTGVEMSGVGPRCSPKSKVHLTEPWLPEPPGGEMAHSLPVSVVV